MGLIILTLAFGALMLGVGIAISNIDFCGPWEGFAVFGMIILLIGLCIGGCALHENAYKELYTEKYRMEYEMLSEQYNGDYYNKFTYDGRKALMDDILGYNKKVITGRAKHNSQWIGALYPEDWDSLPLIDLGGKTE